MSDADKNASPCVQCDGSGRRVYARSRVGGHPLTEPCDCAGGDPIHPEGLYACEGCGRTYAEYINGCVEDHGAPRRVALVAADRVNR